MPLAKGGMSFCVTTSLPKQELLFTICWHIGHSSSTSILILLTFEFSVTSLNLYV